MALKSGEKLPPPAINQNPRPPNEGPAWVPKAAIRRPQWRPGRWRAPDPRPDKEKSDQFFARRGLPDRRARWGGIAPKRPGCPGGPAGSKPPPPRLSARRGPRNSQPPSGEPRGFLSAAPRSPGGVGPAQGWTVAVEPRREQESPGKWAPKSPGRRRGGILKKRGQGGWSAAKTPKKGSGVVPIPGQAWAGKDPLLANRSPSRQGK